MSWAIFLKGMRLFSLILGTNLWSENGNKLIIKVMHQKWNAGYKRLKNKDKIEEEEEKAMSEFQKKSSGKTNMCFTKQFK